LRTRFLQESVQISNAEYEAFAVGGLLISVQRVKSGKGASKKVLQDNVSVDKTGPFFSSGLEGSFDGQRLRDSQQRRGVFGCCR